jgi:hypothetical protein
MYRAGIEGILGFRREGALLVVDPCIPGTWPGFEAEVKVGSTRYEIRVKTAVHRDAARAVLDGVRVELAKGEGVRVALDGKSHTLLIAICIDAATTDVDRLGDRQDAGQRFSLAVSRKEACSCFPFDQVPSRKWLEIGAARSPVT